MTLPTAIQVNIANTRLNETRALGQPDLSQYESDIEYFRKNIGDVQSDVQLVSDKRLFDFAMAAFDLPNDRNARGFMRTLLLQNPDDPSALVNQLDNPRYKEFASLFRFPGTGEQAVKSPDVVDAVVQRFRDVKIADARLDVIADPQAVRGKIATGRHREINYFLENIGNVKTADDLVGDYRLYQFVVTAFDLQGQENAQGLIRKLITEDFDDDGSLYNRLQNTQFREFANFFQFPGAGERNVQDQRQVMAVIDRYVEVATEIEEGEQNPGARLAMYFSRNAGDVETYFGVLADRPLREFVFQAFSLPPELNQLPAPRLAARLEELVDLNEFKTEEGRDKLIKRFSALYDVQNPTSVSSPLLSLFQGGGGVSIVDAASLVTASLSR